MEYRKKITVATIYVTGGGGCLLSATTAEELDLIPSI